MAQRMTTADLLALVTDIRKGVDVLEAEIKRDIRACGGLMNANTQRMNAQLEALYARNPPICLDKVGHGLNLMQETEAQVRDLQSKVRAISTMTQSVSYGDADSPLGRLNRSGANRSGSHRGVTPAARTASDDVGVEEGGGDGDGDGGVDGDGDGEGDVDGVSQGTSTLPRRTIHDEGEEEEEEVNEGEEDDDELKDEVEEEESTARVRLDYGQHVGAAAGGEAGREMAVDAAADSGSSSSSSSSSSSVTVAVAASAVAVAVASGGGGLFEDAQADGARTRRPRVSHEQQGLSSRGTKQQRANGTTPF